jgi:hypothetical protein
VVPVIDDALPDASSVISFRRDDDDNAPTFVGSLDPDSPPPPPPPPSDTGLDVPTSGDSATAADDEDILRPAPAPSPSKQLLAEAEKAGRHGNLDAVRLYIDAARAFETEGALQDAAFAWAEAGQVANVNEDYAGAERCFTRSMQVLGVIETPINYVVPIGLSLIEGLSKQRRWPEAEALISQLHTQVTDALLELDAPDLDDKAKSRAAKTKAQLLQTDLELDNASAGLAFAQGDLALAGARALAVAEAMAELGNVRAAAHAFLNAGESLAQVMDERAIYAYESAMEAWSILRMRDQRMSAADNLVATLRAFGRGDQADELAQNL